MRNRKLLKAAKEAGKSVDDLLAEENESDINNGIERGPGDLSAGSSDLECNPETVNPQKQIGDVEKQ